MKKLYPTLIIVLLILPIWAQVNNSKGSTLQSLLAKKEYHLAQQLFEDKIKSFLQQGQLDSAAQYISYCNEVYPSEKNKEGTINACRAIIEKIKQSDSTPELLCKSYVNAAEVANIAGDAEATSHMLQEATSYAEKTTSNKYHYQALTWCAKGNINMKQGDLEAAKTEYKKTIELLRTQPDAAAEDKYAAYLGLGNTLFYSSLNDSALIYFNNALAELGKAPQNNLNKYYRLAYVKNNIAGIYQLQGKTSEAVALEEETIALYQKYLETDDGWMKRKEALNSMFAAMDNLGGIYRDLREYRKAEQLQVYSYRRKRLEFGEDYRSVHISEIILGQYYNLIGDYDKAKSFLIGGIKGMSEEDNKSLFWLGDGYRSLAYNYEVRNQVDSALYYYNRAEVIYDKAYGDNYDRIYIEFIHDKADFLARNGAYEQALQSIKKVGTYLTNIGEDEEIQGYYHAYNLANIHYVGKNYKEAANALDRALRINKKIYKDGINKMNLIQMNEQRIPVLVLMSRVNYALTENKDTTFLKNTLTQLDSIMNLFKSYNTAYGAEDFTGFISNYKSLVKFYSLVASEIYNATHQNQYLEAVVNLNENMISNKMRSRITDENITAFNHIPDSILQREALLKASLNDALNPESGDANFEKYVHACNNWENYLSQLEASYPEYYVFRYAPLFHTLPHIQNDIPDSTTLVRYYFLDQKLCAVVADNKKIQLITLQADSLPKKITDASDTKKSEIERLHAYHDIYKMIWEPLALYIHTKKIMVIPDEVLYSINLEMLPVSSVTKFAHLVNNSLIAKHTFSYHYSLFVLKNETKDTVHLWNEDFVAFAPVFSDELKKQYTSSVTDSISLDQTYLNLLPQPNIIKAANEIKSKIGGRVYQAGDATKNAFIKNANNKKIVQIGTHGEYNNVLPSMSGLFFAKDKNDSTDNFLTLNEIYSHDFHTQLLMLTACETGKPGYKDGEGMVSLAHAFNYSGSRNILTALWKIDEAATAKITKDYISALQSGQPTDEALRTAKLNYLSSNEGRLLAPEYWSGLILMGRPLTIELSNAHYKWVWIAASFGIILLSGIVFFYYKRNRKQTDR